MNKWILFYIWENWGPEAQSRNMNFPRLLSQETAGLAPIPQSFTVSIGVSWKKPNFQWQGVGTTWSKGTFGTILFLPSLVPTPWGSLLCTHCPPAGGWTAGLGEDDHGPGCHSSSGSRSGHSAEPVGSQRAEVRAIPKMGVQDSTALTSGPDFLVSDSLYQGWHLSLLIAPEDRQVCDDCPHFTEWELRAREEKWFTSEFKESQGRGMTSTQSPLIQSRAVLPYP